jgi:hypothetical protein
MRALLTVAWLVAAAFLTWHAITFKASAIEHDILTRSAKAVKALDTDAEVFADGRFVTIRRAPSETAKATLLATAMRCGAFSVHMTKWWCPPRQNRRRLSWEKSPVAPCG